MTQPTDPGPSEAHEPAPEPVAAPASASAQEATRAPESTRTAESVRIPGGLLVAGAVVAILSLLLVGTLSFVAGVGADRLGLFGSPDAGATSGTSGDELGLIREAWGLLHTKYVDAVNLDSKRLAYAAITAMTEAVDDTGHTMFMTPEEYATSKAALSGSYAGVGAEMNLSTTGDAIVVNVFRGTPAEKAGLKPGDIVLRIDDASTGGWTLDEVVGRIRGPEGTAVTLTIRRDGETATRTLRIVRAKVEIPVVESAMVPGSSIWMVRVEQFSAGVGETLRARLKELFTQRPTGLILDLRGNPGGYVNEAVSVASEFLASGVVYLQRDATRVETSTGVTAGGIATQIPLVVLVDDGSASAAEIVTGALQDPGRATVVGMRTFGTGTVLGTFELADGSALRIGTLEWLTPKGRVIWHQGLEPDIVVELPIEVRKVLPDDLPRLTPAELRASPDRQVLRALQVLLGRPY